MSCSDLASTGFPLLPILGLAAASLLTGLILLLASRTGHSQTTTTFVLLLLISVPLTAAITSRATAHAATPTCPPAARPSSTPPAPTIPSLNTEMTIIQTSVIRGLAPGIAPVTINGIITNHGRHDTRVTAITVSIATVTKAPGAAAGHCDASDYTIVHSTMSLDATLKPNRAATFTGATIGFHNKLSNQDACKSATITLHYTSTN